MNDLIKESYPEKIQQILLEEFLGRHIYMKKQLYFQLV